MEMFNIPAYHGVRENHLGRFEDVRIKNIESKPEYVQRRG
jgi:hypothetical protein